MERLGSPSQRRRAQEALVAAIRSGEFPDGRLPPENELALRLGVSRTTVRAALQALELDGLLTRRRGIGTHLVDRSEGAFQLELTRLGSLDDLFRERGHVPSTRILDVRTEVIGQLAEDFGYPADTEWHVIEKIQCSDGQPAAIITDHISRCVLADLPPGNEAVDDIFRLFEEFGPEPIVLARLELIPLIADATVAERLDIPIGTPLLRLWQRLYGRVLPSPKEPPPKDVYPDTGASLRQPQVPPSPPEQQGQHG